MNSYQEKFIKIISYSFDLHAFILNIVTELFLLEDREHRSTFLFKKWSILRESREHFDLFSSFHLN